MRDKIEFPPIFLPLNKHDSLQSPPNAASFARASFLIGTKVKARFNREKHTVFIVEFELSRLLLVESSIAERIAKQSA